MKRIAIITVDYNNHTDTLEFAESAKKLNTKKLDTKFIFIDNASEEQLKIAGEVIQTGENKGFAGGYNQGIRYALQWGADYLLIVNNDVLFPDKNLLQKLLRSQADVVSPKILFAPGFEFQKDRYSNKEIGKVIWYAGGAFDWNNVQTVHRGIDEVDHGQFNVIQETEFPSGCCMLVRREVFEKVGLFNEQIWAYFEDADFAKRVKEAGFRQIYNGQAYIYHKVSRSSGIGSSLTDYLLTRNRLYFGFKYANTRTRFALLREAFKFFLTGRKYQKLGAMDFFQNKFGKPDFVHDNLNVIFPIKLSIVVINYQTVDLTRKCLQSITHTGVEVILVDNASGDDCAQMVKEFPEVKFIANKINNGFSGANNQSIDYSRGEYVLLLNSDTEAKTDALQNLVRAADKLGGSTITAGRLFFPDGSDQDSVFNLPTVTGALKEYFFKQKGSYFMFQPTKLTKVECAVMACFMIPRKVINTIGKLDEGTFMYFEDVEYCRRAKKNHIPVYFVPDAEFMHHHGASSKKIGQAKSYELLKKGSYYYHGALKYWALYVVLWLGQRFGAKSPTSRWKN